MQKMKMLLILIFLIQIKPVIASHDRTFKSLDKRIVTVNDDKYVFHWARKETIKKRTNKNFDQASTYEYIHKTLQYAQNKGNDSGLYFALDPLVSSGHGGFGGPGDDWVLITYKIPKGTRFLDSVSNLELSLREKLWFKKRGCPTKSLKNFGQVTMINGNDCAIAFNHFYKIKNISGIIYAWGQMPLPFCAPYSPDDSSTDYEGSKAIILKDLNAISSENIFILDSSRNLINPHLQEVKRILNTFISIFQDQYQIEELSFPTESSFSYEELKKRIMNCN